MSQTYVAFDLETTGLDSQRDAIIEIGCAKLHAGEIVDQWSTLVNPGRKLSFAITQLTGIADRDLIGQPSIAQAISPLRQFVGSSTIVAHNASFDLGFIRAAGLSFSNPVLDTFEIASIVLPGRSSYSLGALAAEFGAGQSHAHRALDDARATALLLAALQAQSARLPLATLIEINRLASQTNWSLRAFFAEAEKEASRSVFLKTYERKALEAGGLEPLLNPELRHSLRFEPELMPVEQPAPIDVDLLAAFLEPDGPLAQALPGYEHRQPQVEMLRAVGDAFNNSDHLLIEAGTGTGKSLAYLLPAIAWSIQNRSRVVVSTNTINLQDQLYTKDVPDLLAVFQRLQEQPAKGDSRFQQFAHQASGLRVALIKGRSNYLCLRRLDIMRSRADLGEEELRVLARVLVWLAQTSTGDRAEIFLWGGREEAVWARLAAESGSCTPERCESGRGVRCFYYHNRRQADSAHLLIANHALLLADVAAGNRVLPDYRHLIVDEAHHLEDATTRQLGYSASQPMLERMLHDVYPEGGEGRSGILYDVRRRLEKAGLAPSNKQALDRQILLAQRGVEHVRDLLRQFFAVLGEFLTTDQTAVGPYGLRVRLERKVRSQPGYTQVEIAWDTVSGPLYELAQALESLSQGLGELNESGAPGLDDVTADMASLASQFSEAYTQMHAAIGQPDENGIYWAEVNGNERTLSLHMAPLHVGPLVEQHLFMAKDTVVLTSATLRTAGSYSYIQERLHAREARTQAVSSPFDYQASTLVFVPTDMADPNGPAFQRQVEQAIDLLARALDGRTMALFTANQQLRQTAEALGPGLAAAGITLFQQGSGGSRRQLLENFRNTPRSLLLGTRSFWEGVDVVGAALSGLVLVRLPFAVPNDPVVAARAETFDDAFYQYSVPDAILRFRQGFGRLIRSRQDRGVCVILDNRVITKRYGQLFLESLPDCTVQKAPLGSLAGAAKGWLAHSP